MKTIARHELKVILRSKWVMSFAMMYTVLAVIIVFFGASGEETGYAGFNRTTASLLNISLFLIPLLTLLIGSTALAGEKEEGGLGLLLTYPISPLKIILGKYIGLLLALLAVISIGYGLAGLVAVVAGSRLSFSVYFLFYLFTVLLTLMCLSLALLLGVFAKTRFQALGLSILIWAAFVLFYEFIVIGLSMVSMKTIVLPLFSASILLNPVELIRVWTIISMNSGTIFGPTLYDLTVWSESIAGQATFSVAAALWMIAPLYVATLSLKGGLRHEG